jgi:hypothetical protein
MAISALVLHIPKISNIFDANTLSGTLAGSQAMVVGIGSPNSTVYAVVCFATWQKV